MGKRKEPPGYKLTGKRQYKVRQKEQLATVGLLLGAEWDDYHQCFFRQYYDDATRAVITHLFNRRGEPITKSPRELENIKKLAAVRQQERAAEERRIAALKKPLPIIPDLWGKRMVTEFLKPNPLAEKSDILDATQYTDTIKIRMPK